MRSAVPLLPFLALLTPLAGAAQDEPPPRHAEVELARSRACVGALARLEELESLVRPLGERMERLRALGRAVSLEDRDEAGSLDPADPVAAAVDAWFVADSTLAVRYVAERDEAIQGQRTAAREAVLDQIRQAMQGVEAEAQVKLEGAAEVERAAEPCQGSAFVRSAVLEACTGLSTLLCQAATGADAQAPFRFVDDPDDLWDIEDYRPWTRPGPLQGTPQGALVGGRTASQARRGNVVVAVALAPLIRARAELTEEVVRDFEENLDSLGFTFDHPLFVMVPAFEVDVMAPPPIGGETHVLLHFGDLSGDDVVWSAEIGEGGLFEALVPADGLHLGRLRDGETLSLTAIRMAAVEGAEADAVYSLPLLTVNQSQAVGALIQYMGSGDLGRDLARLIPPSGGSPPAR